MKFNTPSSIEAIVITSLLLTACGGGGGGSTPPAAQSIQVSGSAVKGPLANAEVSVYSFDSSQAGFKGALVDSGTTDAKAAITGVSLPDPAAPPYIMEITSVTGTTDITTGVYPVITTLRTVITQSLIDSGDPLYATPLTTMAVDIAIANSASGSSASDFALALAHAADQVSSTFGFGMSASVDIFDTPPLIDGTTTSSTSQADVAAYRAAVEAVTAVAYQIQQQSTAADTDTILADLADGGTINGSGSGSHLTADNLQVLQQDPATLPIPNKAGSTVGDIQALLASEVTQTGQTTPVTALTNGSITTTTTPAEPDPDLDGDGVANFRDAFPLDASESTDTDHDGIGNNADDDDDNDGWNDSIDDYPLDATRYLDPALDRDSDSVLNGSDNCPLIANPDQLDTDSNGTGDACDNDNDGDGVDDSTDNCPSIANASQSDLDLDSTGDVCDDDIDGDGVSNANDAFPLNDSESIDTDHDGIGNNADTDDDNDGLSDTEEATLGTDPLKRDTDGDGVLDSVDFAPLDPLVSFNFAPTATGTSYITTEDTALDITLEVTDSTALPLGYVYSGPSNGVLSGTEPNLTYTPDANFNGSDSFTYTVTDTGGKSAQATVSITVNAANDAPAFTSSANTAATQDQAYSYSVTTQDNDGDSLTLSAGALSSWLSFTDNGDGSGTLSGTPANANVGDHQVTLSVSDGSNSVEQSFIITVANVNDAPVLQDDSAIVGVGTSVSIAVLANDVDIDPNDPLTITSVTQGTLGSVAINGTSDAVLYTETNGSPGSDSFSYTVTDAGGISTTANVTITTTMDAPPAFDSVPAIVASEDSVYSYTVSTSDADGDSMTLSAVSIPAWLTFTDNGSGSGTLSGTPLNGDVGIADVTLRVTANGASVDQSFFITVSNTNDAPTFTSTPVTTAQQSVAYSYSVTVNDIDPGPDTLTLSAATLPAWLSFNAQTGVLSGTPGSTNIGDHAVVIRVNDGTVDVDQSFTITVASGVNQTAQSAINTIVDQISQMHADGALTPTEISDMAGLLSDDFLLGGADKALIITDFNAGRLLVPAGNAITCTVTGPLGVAQLGTHEDGVWANCDVGLYGNAPTANAFVMDAGVWYWMGELTWVDPDFRVIEINRDKGAGQEIDSTLCLCIADETDYAWNQGAHSAIVTGPGLPSSGVVMSHPGQGTGSNFSVVSPSGKTAWGYSLTDAEIQTIPDTGAQYTFALYSQDASLVSLTDTPLSTINRTLAGRPLTRTELANAAFPLITSATTHSVSEANLGGSYNLTWDLPAGLAEVAVDYHWKTAGGEQNQELNLDWAVGPLSNSQLFDTSANADTTNPDGVIVTVVGQDASGREMRNEWHYNDITNYQLTCGYESGWNDTLYGGNGGPITPNSFAEYESVIASCNSNGTQAIALTPTAIVGTNDRVTLIEDNNGIPGFTTFRLGGAAGTQADPGTAVHDDGRGVFTTLHWWVEAAGCSGCNYSYIVLYTDATIQPGLPTAYWLRETYALTGVTGTPGVGGAIYDYIGYSESSDFSNLDRASASGEIWYPQLTVSTAISGGYGIFDPVNNNNKLMLSFFPDNFYIHYQDDAANDPTCVGVEYGNYVYDGTTYTATPYVDENSGCGFSGWSANYPVTVTSNSFEFFFIDINDIASIPKVTDSQANSIVGAWDIRGQGSAQALVFYANGNYVQYTDDSANGCTSTGIEYGSYSFDGTTLTGTSIVDDNLDCGGATSTSGESFSIPATVSGDILSISPNTFNRL